jgi:hypothetical protein
VDAGNRPGAEALASTIEAYWRKRGADVEVRVERIVGAADRQSKVVYGVRTSLRAGMPP